jgi:hypothetical protein
MSTDRELVLELQRLTDAGHTMLLDAGANGGIRPRAHGWLVAQRLVELDVLELSRADLLRLTAHGRDLYTRATNGLRPQRTR